MSKIPTTTLESVKAMMKSHDWHYAFSDDGRVYRDGRAEEEKLYALAAQLPQAEIDRLWSEHPVAKEFSRPVSKVVVVPLS